MKPKPLLSPEETQEQREAFYRDIRRDYARRWKHFNALSSEACFNLAQTFARPRRFLLTAPSSPTDTFGN
jgi:hypothetical protein